MGQLSGRNSLRDIVENLSAQTHRLYRLGSAKMSRSNLAGTNEDKPAVLYEALFGRLIQRCPSVAPGHNFNFANPLYSLDASTIDLCLYAFPWADFRTTKGAVKLHVRLNQAGYLPEFVTITGGKNTTLRWGERWTFPRVVLSLLTRRTMITVGISSWLIKEYSLSRVSKKS